MEFGWPEQQQRYLGSVTRFAEQHLSGDVVERDARQEFWREGWLRCGGFGIQGLAVPTEHGGGGADRLTVVAALEALGYGCSDNGLLFALNAHMWGAAVPVFTFGTDEQKKRYLPGMCDGSLVGALAMTEPGSGSDAHSLTTTATRQDGGYVLNGHKVFVTNAPIADALVVIATTDPAGSWATLTTFLLDRDTPGLHIGEPVSKMGLRTALMSEVTLTDCRVPEECLLGAPGGGMAVFGVAMDWERCCILASAVGTMRRLLERCADRARKRRQFGQPIGNFQAVSHKLADMRLRTETARLLLYRSAWLADQGRQQPADSAMVKLHLSESLVQTSMDALQVHGGQGYLTETELERQVRDSLAARLYSGTSEMQRGIIASAVTGPLAGA
jgi:alkylation response protein AidB-like acyl-CoA dehydrogenase